MKHEFEPLVGDCIRPRGHAMRILQVYHRNFARYYDLFRKNTANDVTGYDCERRDDSEFLRLNLLEYDWIHFWAELPIETMMAVFSLRNRPTISYTNSFGNNNFKDGEQPFDIQFHVSKMAMARYYRETVNPWQRENVVSYLPVNTQTFNPANMGADTRQRIREMNDLSNEDFVICRSGRPDVWKWDLFLVRLAKRLTGKVKVLVIGGIPRFVEKEIKRLGVSHMFRVAPFIDYGSGPDVRNSELVFACDAYVYSSFIGESCGISILEAMAMKKPVIVRNTPWADNAPAEYIENGRSGYLCDDLSEAEQIVTSLRTGRLSPDVDSARESVMEMFRPEVVVRRMENAVSVCTKRSAEVPSNGKHRLARAMFLAGIQARRRGLVS